MKLAAMLTKSLLNDNVILEDETNIITYGLENLIGNIVGILVILVMGAFFHHTLDSFMVWLLAFPLRKYAGGFHAKTRGRCLITSITMILISFVIFFQFEWEMMTIFLIALAFSIIIFFLAPVGNPNKPLDELEHKMYQMKSRGFLLVEGMVLCFALCFKQERMVIAITICFFMVGISLLAGTVKLKYI